LENDHARDVLLAVIRKHGGNIDDVYANWCVTVAEGNPYFLQELANHWIETGEEHSVPPSLTAIINERLSRLSPDTLQLLQACAVLEQNSTLDCLDAVLEYDAREMLLAINELGRTGMLVVSKNSRNGGPDRLLPRHEILASIAISKLSAPARAFLHRRTASTLEKSGHERSAAIFWDAAKHWQLAGDTTHAFELARSCAKHLMDLGLPAAAADAYSKTLGYCATVEEKVATLSGLAIAQYASRAWKEIEATVTQLQELKRASTPDFDEHNEFELMTIRAQRAVRGAHLTLDKAIACLTAESATPNHRVSAGGTALMICDELCDHETMRSIYERIAPIFSLNSVDDFLRLRAEMVYHSVCGDLTKGVASAKAAVEEQRRRANPSELFTILCNAANSCRTAGLFDDAETALQEAYGIAEQQGVGVSAATALLDRIYMHLELGNTKRSRQLYDALITKRVKPENDESKWRVPALATRLALLEGRHADAMMLTRNSLKYVRLDRVADRRVYHLALIVAARLHNKGRDFEEALPLLEKAYLRARVNSRQAFATSALYHALLATGNVSRAEQLLNDYLTYFRREPWPVDLKMMRRLVGLT
jgi:tetratricopeptide (TPR) repeat protein